MMRDDNKKARRWYELANRVCVPDSAILLYGRGRFAKIALMNGTKFLLEVNWAAGIDLIGDE